MLPVNWKLAAAAFMEGYHVPQTHPQLLPSSHTVERSPVHPVIETSLHFMRTLGSGMGEWDARERHEDCRRAATYVAAR